MSIATNRIVIQLSDPQPSDRQLSDSESLHEDAELEFAEQSGLIVAGWRKSGWIQHLPEAESQVLRLALLGFYKSGTVTVIREQIEARLCDHNRRYDIGTEGIILWPDPSYREEVIYSLSDQPIIHPRPRAVAKANGLESIRRDEVLYQDQTLEWDAWVAAWECQKPAELMTDGGQPRLLPSIMVFSAEDKPADNQAAATEG